MLDSETLARDLHILLDLQGTHGNWNFSPYTRGLYNGLELALAILEEREAQYRDEPADYLYERPEPATPNRWGDDCEMPGA